MLLNAQARKKRRKKYAHTPSLEKKFLSNIINIANCLRG